MKVAIFCAVLIAVVGVSSSHTYHWGDCPVVEPKHGFEMNRFLGVWYVIQKTSTASNCVVYNYTRGEEPGEYIITQDSVNPILGLTPLKHEYHYTGELSVPEPSTPARMQVRFPLNVAGSATHVVFSTDYDNYAAVFSCQKIASTNRQSATILSRRRDLDSTDVDEIRNHLSTFGVNPYDLSIVTQNGCPTGNNSLDINITPHTFSAENIGNVVRKIGAKLGDGVQWVARTGSNIYHKISGSSNDRTPNMSENQAVPNSRPSENEAILSNDVEWLP